MKKIMLLATGGTIACTKTENGLAPTLRAGDLAQMVQQEACVTLEAKDVFLIDSSNMQPEEWCKLAQAVREALQHCDGVVITHGTDTMAYTASALSFLLIGISKPVILTGSQLPISHPLTDARLNLLRSLMVAQSGMGGVYVCFGNDVISGVHCVKTHTTSMEAFSSVNAPLCGFFDVEGFHMGRHTLYQPMALCYGQLHAALDPNVYLLKLIPGTSTNIFRFVAEAGYRGLIIEVFGLGGLHYIRRNLVKALDELVSAGVLVLVVSQCLYQKSDITVYEVGHGLAKDRIFSGYDMTTETAVCKMMWALMQEDSHACLRHNFLGEFRHSS